MMRLASNMGFHWMSIEFRALGSQKMCSKLKNQLLAWFCLRPSHAPLKQDSRSRRRPLLLLLPAKSYAQVRSIRLSPWFLPMQRASYAPCRSIRLSRPTKPAPASKAYDSVVCASSSLAESYAHEEEHTTASLPKQNQAMKHTTQSSVLLLSLLSCMPRWEGIRLTPLLLLTTSYAPFMGHTTASSSLPSFFLAYDYHGSSSSCSSFWFTMGVSCRLQGIRLPPSLSSFLLLFSGHTTLSLMHGFWAYDGV